MSFCPIRRSSGQFNSVLQSFVQGAGLPLRDALGEDLIERVAQEESAFFGAGPGVLVQRVFPEEIVRELTYRQMKRSFPTSASLSSATRSRRSSENLFPTATSCR